MSEIVFGLTGQTFVYDPPEMGRPSSPSVTVYLTTSDDDGSTETATTGAASVDSVNTTLSASASAGDKTITVTSGTSITKGRRYLLTAADGDTAWVDVRAVSGTSVILRNQLNGDFASGSTFQGCRLSIAVDSTWVNDKSNITDASAGHPGYRVRWVYTVLGSEAVGVSFYDLVRYPSKNIVTALDVDRAFPGWIDRLGQDNYEDQGATLIAEAFRDVRMDALGDDQALRRFRNTDVVKELVIHKANAIAIRNQVMAGSANLDGLKTAEDLYTKRYQQLVREPKIPVDPAGGGAAAEGQRLPLWRR